MSGPKRIVLVVAILLLIAVSLLALRFGRLRGKAIKFVKSRIASASSVTLSWDSNPPGEDVISYKIYEHVADKYRLLGQANFSTFYTVRDIGPGRHAYVVTAVSYNGESAHSSEVSHP